MPRGRKHKKSNGKNKRKHNHHQSTVDSKADSEEDNDCETKDRLYEIQSSEIIGRYLVASRDIEQASVIFHEDALVVGPSQDTRPLCLGCYKSLNLTTSSRCSKCKWPLCANDCPGLHTEHGHSEAECAALAKCPPPTVNDLTTHKAYNAIVPLRCLLLKSHNPAKWNILQTLEAHNSIRKKLNYIWECNQKYIVDRIRNTWKMEEHTEEEIHTVCGYLEVNAFEVGQGGISIRALYPNVFLVAHDCTPNTSHNDNENYQLVVRAASRIKQGQLITLSYANTLHGTLRRREHLKTAKFFDCICARCSDPTELGTNLSSLKCPKCLKGAVLSTKPLDDKADWLCTNCSQYSVPYHTIEKLIERIQNGLDSIGMDSVVDLENFLKKYEKVLHPQHYIMIAAKYSLSQLYGKAPGYVIHQLSDDLLMRKRDICSELLKVFDVIEPGYSRLRGVTLYEIHAPIMILFTRRFEANSIQKKEVKIELKQVIRYLREASTILNFETENSMEKIMGKAATEALERMKDWERIIGKL
ncbi:SET domain-containing protein SmydA-8 isoform X2 [Nilaparvata lugens]|uniref:SET domain-containing protein SmydA-8 isoform X2 n=1 Tax=Nilaparvata lugens TaxID=108931 RepID=UPI00193DB933|nr:SET domain-containing protein SmydA-8 isoform X2 [Nilaparvata lugens]